MIGPGVTIGRNCVIGANAVIGFALIGDRVSIHAARGDRRSGLWRRRRGQPAWWICRSWAGSSCRTA
ncbi:hypothetical protein [Caulobacter sp. B11]|uniref:hypothetical protein n=1 Tax=Caulobacter sp. B11 TaxID=2048899 RepID=UPI001F26C213|nr:hypothetical protein [Caulobacter sp. B11]